uniref:Smr domain-containing protein n=1 Tax=Culex tarsalis TaxID=7177 RepID=A0A1Q3F0Z1_CULTA
MQTDEMLAQLTEMFGDYMDQTQIATAVLCNNDLESCIEFLLKDDNVKEVTKPAQPTSTGAIKKTVPQKSNGPTDFASFLKSGNQQFGILPQRTNAKVGRGDEFPPNFAEIVEKISKGFRVMVLMRGPPGSGKSHLSRALVDKTLGNSDYRNHVFGADDYFLVNGVYRYQPDRLDEAHRFNQNNVRAKAIAGWSPIIVDNTNMKHWEMHAYVEIAADHGYLVRVLEPVTHWRKSARALAARNVHGVPEAKIKTMLLNYERLRDVSELYRQCKLERALESPPKMRHYPIMKEDLLETAPDDATVWTTATDWEASNDVPSNSPDGDGECVDLSNIPIPKPPRQTPVHHFGIVEARQHQDEDQILAVQMNSDADDGGWSWPVANDVEVSWKPYDEESANFWTGTDHEGQMATTAARIEQQQQQPPLSLLAKVTIPSEWKTPDSSNGVTPVKAKEKRSERKKSDKKRIALVKHRRGCENENSSFSEICNLYPHVPASYLWDLFEKCNGDGDWTANLLLEDQKVQDYSDETSAGADLHVGKNVLECTCNEPMAMAAHVTSTGDDTDRSTVSSPRSTMRKKDKTLSEDVQLAKKKLEALVVLEKQNYSKHIQQIRVAKGIISKQELEQETEMEQASSDEIITSDPEIFEVFLGVELVKQLHEIFKAKHSTKSFSIDDLTPERTKVFISSEMAEQIYLSFMDSVYSCHEEEKLVTLKRDAQIAKQMDVKERYPKLFNEKLNSSETPKLADIIEMELALTAYRNEMNGWTQEAPRDLASQMTRQKLAEMYPNVEQNVLAEILHAHDNKFNDTVNVLNNSIPEKLRSQIAREREALLKRTEPVPVVPPPPPGLEQSISGEEAINLHLKTAEECRNLAQHHQDLKNECHEKARNAIQRGIAGVAEYYAQIARLHRTKIDLYNSKASNSIMEVHKLTLNNADVLDLHYLHSEEALRCLEIFLADHARKLRTRQQQYKELFIITGRGLHSADGIPIIKHRVKAMLRDLGLRSVELNPGFLKIKVYNNQDVLERLLVPQC